MHVTHLRLICLSDQTSTGNLWQEESPGEWPYSHAHQVGWVLSGPVQCPQVSVNLNFCSMHTRMIESPPNVLKLGSFLGVGVSRCCKNELPVAEKFSQQITFNGKRYSVALQWKEDHLPLPNHLDLCHKRLQGLLKRLKQNPPLLKDYYSVIKDQIDNGIVEVVDNPLSGTDNTHYLPHHCVVQLDKSITNKSEWCTTP